MSTAAIGSHHSARMLEDRWLTPPWILQPLGAFGLDPCAAPDPRPWPTAARHVTRPQDGLSAEWGAGERVWLNPPYSSQVGRWLGKLSVHPGGGTALVFARTETSWFWECVWQRASAALFLQGRIHFCRPDGRVAADNAGAPSVLVAYGSEDAERLAASGLPGAFVCGWAVTGSPALEQAGLFGGAA